MPGFYLDHRVCAVCLGARRLGGEPCDNCAGTGHEPPIPPGGMSVVRTAIITGLTNPPMPQLGDPYPEPPDEKTTPADA